MSFIASDHIALWFTRNPGKHRTDQQGGRIICPIKQKLGYSVASIERRPTRVGQCPFCQAHLGHAEPIPHEDHKGEFFWPTAA